MRKYCVVFILGWVLTSAWPQNVSEEAARHQNRGLAAVEMAKTAADYQAAIDEFQEAARLAPDWPDAWYNLGLVQDKAGRYEAAATSLKRYLELAPDAPEAAAVKQQVDKLQYKAERAQSDEGRMKLIVGDWDRFESGELTNVYHFYANGSAIEYRYTDALGPMVCPVEFDGKNVRFKHLARSPSFVTEYAMNLELVEPGVLRGSFTTTALKVPEHWKGQGPGPRGTYPCELKKHQGT